MQIDMFDEGKWPLVTIRMPKQIDNAIWSQGLEQLQGYLGRHQRLAFLTLPGGVPDAGQRKQMAAFLEEHDQLLRSYLCGWGMVVTSSLLRGAITAITWLRPPPFEQRVFASADDAESWLRERLESASS